MKETELKQLSEEEEYEETFLLFYTELETLSKGAEEQCEIMGNFNMAYELRYDGTRDAKAVLDFGRRRLSDQQLASVRRFLADLASVPDSAVNVPNTKEEHIRAMSLPCWVPIRLLAEELMSNLAAERERILESRSQITKTPK